MAMKKKGGDKSSPPSLMGLSTSQKKKLNELTQAYYAAGSASASRAKSSSPSASTRAKTAANRMIVAERQTRSKLRMGLDSPLPYNARNKGRQKAAAPVKPQTKPRRGTR